MEKLIVIVVIIGAAMIHSWIKRKQEEAEARETDPDAPQRKPPPLPSEPSPRSPGGWQEELRRLLQGEAPTPSPRPPVSRPKPAVPPPVIKPTPEPAAPRPFLARSSIPVPEMGREMEVGLSVRPVSLDQASAAHQRASHLQQSVVQRMQETTSKVSTHAATVLAARRATNADRVRLLLREKETQRSAILASVILGPPRAVES